MRRIILMLLFAGICIALALDGKAQENNWEASQQNTQGENLDNTPIDPNDAPIDGGLGILIAAGAAYGVKKYRHYKKDNDAGKAVA